MRRNCRVLKPGSYAGAAFMGGVLRHGRKRISGIYCGSDYHSATAERVNGKQVVNLLKTATFKLLMLKCGCFLIL